MIRTQEEYNNACSFIDSDMELYDFILSEKMSSYEYNLYLQDTEYFLNFLYEKIRTLEELCDYLDNYIETKFHNAKKKLETNLDLVEKVSFIYDSDKTTDIVPEWNFTKSDHLTDRNGTEIQNAIESTETIGPATRKENQIIPKLFTKKENNPIPNFRLSRVFFFILFFASVFLAIRVYGLSNIRLLLKGDTTSRTLSLDSSGSIIVSFVQYAMIPCILSMWISSNNKKEKIYSIIALLLFLIESFVISFTRIFMISLLIMIFFHEMLKKNKKSQVTSSIIAIVCIVALLVILNYIRCLGFSYNLSFKTLLNIDVIFESTDFSASYNMFNELLKHKSPFINPIVYLKPLFIFIPRTLWLTKPEYLNVQVLRYINPLAAESGLSSGISIMGEGYAVLSYFGSILYCFIWGIICSKMDRKYYERIENGNITSVKNLYYYIFAILFVISAQRGDWSVYLTTIIFLYILTFSI